MPGVGFAGPRGVRRRRLEREGGGVDLGVGLARETADGGEAGAAGIFAAVGNDQDRVAGVASLAQMLHGERDGVEQRGATVRLGEQQTVLQFGAIAGVIGLHLKLSPTVTRNNSSPVARFSQKLASMARARLHLAVILPLASRITARETGES